MEASLLRNDKKSPPPGDCVIMDEVLVCHSERSEESHTINALENGDSSADASE